MTETTELDLICQLVSEPEAMRRIGDLGAGDFADEALGEAFVAIEQLWQTGRTLDTALVEPYLRRIALPSDDPLSAATAYDVVMQRLRGDRPAHDVHAMARRVIGAALRREIAAISARAERAAHDPTVDLRQLVSDLDQSVAGVRRRALARARAAQSAAEGFEELYRSLLDTEADCIGTGLASLDEALGGGFERGGMTILGGLPSMGKSALATTLATNAAVQGHGVLIVSLEMTRRSWWGRTASDLIARSGGDVPYVSLRPGRGWTEETVAAIWRPVVKGYRLPIRIHDETKLSITDIVGEIERTRMAFERDGVRLGLVVVDHLGKIKPGKHYRGNRYMEVTEISEELATAAKAFDVAGLVLCQLSRSVMKEERPPVLSDLRDSGAIEQDAQQVLFAHREAYFLETKLAADQQEADEIRDRLRAIRNRLDIIAAKNRGGKRTAACQLWCDLPRNRIREATESEGETWRLAA